MHPGLLSTARKVWQQRRKINIFTAQTIAMVNDIIQGERILKYVEFRLGVICINYSP
jgi:hypothetical protein